MYRGFFTALFCVLTMASAFAQTRIIPHVTRVGGGFTTTVILENGSVSGQSLTLSAFDSTGARLGDVTVELSGREVINQDIETLFPGLDGVSHFEIQGSEEIQASVNYNFASGQGSPALVREANETASRWRLFPGDWNNIFDGIAVVNTGEEVTDLWVAQKDFNNNVIDARQIATELAPNAKALFVIGSPADEVFADRDDVYYEVSGDQLLAVTALRGTLAGADLGLLWANDARAMSQSTSKRDEFDVWYIEDGSMYDVFEMQGYQVASDRLFQLDLLRRLARGTLAALLGDQQIPTLPLVDANNRLLGYSAEELESFYQQFSDENTVIYQAYIDGINRRIGEVNATARLSENDPSVTSLLPFEYNAPGISVPSVEPFEVIDIMAHIASFQRGFSFRRNGFEQIDNAAILQDLQANFGDEQGALMFNDLRRASDSSAITMVGESGRVAKTNQSQFLPIMRKDLADLTPISERIWNYLDVEEKALRKLGIYLKMGSFAWAVSGDMTDTGNPMLISGPQISFSTPSQTIEGSIKSDYITVSGMGIPGVPGIVVGRTPHHGWSMQVGHASVWDYYLVDESELRVLRSETIEVANSDPIQDDILGNDLGTAIVDNGDGTWMVLAYSQRNYKWDLHGGLMALGRAESMDDFDQGIRNLGVSQHFTYIDKDGNLAYWLSGRTPVRQEGDYRFPQGTLANQDVLVWDHAVVLDPPNERNGEKGYYAGWNNKATPEWIDYAATAGFGPFHRGHSVQAFFRDFDPQNPWTFEQLRDFHITIAANLRFYAGGNPYVFLREDTEDAVAADPTAERQEMIDLLGNWNGQLVVGENNDDWITSRDLTDQGLFVEAFIENAMQLTFNDELGPSDPVNQVDNLFRFHALVHGTGRTGVDNNYNWFQNLNDPAAPQTLGEILVAAMDQTLADLGARPWGEGQRGTVTWTHPLFGDISVFVDIGETLDGRRPTYFHALEYGTEGPVRIESYYQNGNNGTILGAGFAFSFDEDAFIMKDNYDNYRTRPFPNFNDQ
jgi:penicillin amidase